MQGSQLGCRLVRRIPRIAGATLRRDRILILVVEPGIDERRRAMHLGPRDDFYQLSIPAPKAPAGSYDKTAFERGKTVFNSSGKCATCHVPRLYTEPGYNLHPPSEIGVDAFQADRSPTHMYRTAPLAGLWTHQKGGFFHDGRFATLLDVVNHYDTQFNLNLSDENKRDLVEYLKGI
jgi:hypothetical protein